MLYFFNKCFVWEKQNFAVDADVKMSMHRFPMVLKICHIKNHNNAAQKLK